MKEVIDSHLELEANLKVLAEMEKMGGVVYIPVVGAIAADEVYKFIVN